MQQLPPAPQTPVVSPIHVIVNIASPQLGDGSQSAIPADALAKLGQKLDSMDQKLDKMCRIHWRIFAT